MKPFLENNQLWKLRSKHGRNKLFETPELLLESALEYFEWCDNNPWIKTESTKTEKGYIEKEIPTPRPYSRSGWFIYIGCSYGWLKEFKKKCNDDFLLVIEQVENIIDTQQREGATVGSFNANIIARMQGLRDNSDVTTDGEKLNKTQLDANQVKEIARKLRDDY